VSAGKVYNYADSLELRRKLARDAALEVKKFGSILTTDVTELFHDYLREGTPVGRKPNRSKRYGHAPGQLRNSWSTIGITSASGRAWGISNRAGHANMVIPGRRPNLQGYWVRTDDSFDRRFAKNRHRKNEGRYWIKKGGRMLGSLQAPKNVIYKAWIRVKRQQEQLTKLAIAASEAA